MSCKQKQTMLYLPTAIHSTLHGDSNKSFHIENTVRLLDLAWENGAYLRAWSIESSVQMSPRPTLMNTEHLGEQAFNFSLSSRPRVSCVLGRMLQT